MSRPHAPPNAPMSAAPHPPLPHNPPPHNPAPAQPPAERGEIQPLAVVTAMFHAALCQSADVFNSPHRQHPRAIPYTSAQIRASLMGVNERYHDALDILELEIVRAKAVLRRDLSLMRAAAEAENVQRQEALERQQAAQRRAKEEAERKAAAEAKAKADAETAEKRRIEEERRRREEAAAAAAAQAKAEEEERKRKIEEEEAARKRKQEEEEEERKRKELQPIVIDDDPMIIEPKPGTPPTAGSGSFDFLFENTSPGGGIQLDGSGMPPAETAPQANPAPSNPPGQSNAPNQSFDDFLASLPVVGDPSANVNGEVQGATGGEMGAEDDLFNEFDDLFNYGDS